MAHGNFLRYSTLNFDSQSQTSSPSNVDLTFESVVFFFLPVKLKGNCHELTCAIVLTVSGAGRHYGFGSQWKLFALFAFNQCFAKADISGDVCFLFRKLYQVSVNAKVRAVRSESKTEGPEGGI